MVQLFQPAELHRFSHKAQFGMEDANSAPTPLFHKIRLDINISTNREVDSTVYQSIIGSLMYTATSTPPDIVYSITVLCRYNAKSYMAYLMVAKRVLHYLKRNSDVGLVFPRRSKSIEGSDNLLSYTDSDFVGD